MSGSALHVHPALAMLAGGLLLAVVTAYLWLVCTRHEPLQLRRLVIPVPKPRVAFAQVVVACADLLCAAGVLYVLLPQQAAISFGAFAGIDQCSRQCRGDNERRRARQYQSARQHYHARACGWADRTHRGAVDCGNA
jgi:hypothetical protein